MKRKLFNWFVSYSFSNGPVLGDGYATITDSNIDMNTVSGIENMRKLLIQKELENGNEIKHLVPIFFQEIKKT
jgi:hypothetical protein